MNLGRIFGTSKINLSPPPEAWAAVRFKAVVLLLLIFCLMYCLLFVGILSLFCHALLCVHSGFAIILKTKRKLVTLLLLSYRCFVTILFCGSSSRCRGLVCCM